MNIVFFTGAGISVASGLPVYRGEDGIYTPGSNNFIPPVTIDSRTTRESFKYDVGKISKYMREEWTAGPNVSHFMISKLEEKHNVTVITQNIDGLHSVSSNVIELHGNIHKEKWDERFNMTRPDVVFFGEFLDENKVAAAYSATQAADLFVSVGTSGTVYPAATIMEGAFEDAWMAPSKKKAYHIDPELPETGLLGAKHLRMDAEQGLKQLFKDENL